MSETTRTLEPSVDIRRADDRFNTRIGWLDSKHSFSFGRHYDPPNTHHGLLLVNNDDIVAARHRVRDPPAPRHGDRHLGAAGLAGPPGLHRAQRRHLPGLAQRMSAGTGILHSEKNDSWRLAGRRPRTRPGALRADVGRARRGRHHPRLRAARDRRRAARAAAWSRSPPAWTSTTAQRRSASRTGTPRCTPPGCSPAERRAARGAVPAPVRAPRHGRRSRAPARWRRGRRPVHRHRRPAGHGHRAGRDPGLGDARHPRLITAAQLGARMSGCAAFSPTPGRTPAPCSSGRSSRCRRRGRARAPSAAKRVIDTLSGGGSRLGPVVALAALVAAAAALTAANSAGAGPRRRARRRGCPRSSSPGGWSGCGSTSSTTARPVTWSAGSPRTAPCSARPRPRRWSTSSTGRCASSAP